MELASLIQGANIESLIGSAHDLSDGGLFVRTDKPLPVGREVVVDLLPPGWSSPLRLTGTVTNATYSADAGGHSGQPGDRAFRA